jgi:hypothetical protein
MLGSTQSQAPAFAPYGGASRRQAKIHIDSSETYLKFLEYVILNLFQDLSLGTNRDAEPILSQAQHRVQHDNKGLKMLLKFGNYLGFGIWDLGFLFSEGERSFFHT